MSYARMGAKQRVKECGSFALNYIKKMVLKNVGERLENARPMTSTSTHYLTYHYLNLNNDGYSSLSKIALLVQVR